MRCVRTMTRNSGMISATDGMPSSATNAMNSGWRPRKSMHANAYAASAATVSPIATEQTVRMKLLRIQVTNCGLPMRDWKFSRVGESGSDSWFSA